MCVSVGFSEVGHPRRPVVAEPQSRQHVQLGGRRPPVGRGDLHQDVLRAPLGVLHEDVEVAVFLEDAGVEELVLHLVAGAPPVRLHQVGVGIGRLGILVEVLHVRVGRRAVEVEVVLLYVLAVVPFTVREPEDALLENGVLAVPEGQGEAEPLPVVGDAGEAVLAPAIGPRAGVIVAEVVPGVPVLAVVLANGPPLALAEVGAPLLPAGPALARGRQSFSSALILSPPSLTARHSGLLPARPYREKAQTPHRPGDLRRAGSGPRG